MPRGLRRSAASRLRHRPPACPSGVATSRRRGRAGGYLPSGVSVDGGRSGLMGGDGPPVVASLPRRGPAGPAGRSPSSRRRYGPCTRPVWRCCWMWSTTTLARATSMARRCATWPRRCLGWPAGRRRRPWCHGHQHEPQTAAALAADHPRTPTRSRSHANGPWLTPDPQIRSLDAGRCDRPGHADHSLARSRPSQHPFR
jgi:hypothetical protein